jgi:hypothetical protein
MSSYLSRRDNSNEISVRSDLLPKGARRFEDVDENDYLDVIATLRKKSFSVREKVVSEIFPGMVKTIAQATIQERDWLFRKLDRYHPDFGEKLAQLFFDYVSALEPKSQDQFLVTINKQLEHFLELLQKNTR